MLQEPGARATARVVVAARFSKRMAAGVALVLAVSIFALKPLIANAAQPPVGLGTADSFAILAGSGITNTGHTTVLGDVGTYPTPAETGFDPCPGANCVSLNGTNHAGDAVTQGAKDDLVTAYNDAAGRTPVNPIGTELGGQTLNPGVYDSEAGTFGITGTLTLDAQGDSSAVFIFQMASTLITASSSNVNLINGAQACNVWWQVGSSATLGTDSTFRGNILALTSITVTTSVTVSGRVLARDGAVMLDTDTIRRSGCAAPTSPPPTSPPPSGTSPTSPPPSGAPQTGGGSTAGFQDMGLLVIGGALLASAAGAFALRRSFGRKGSSG